MPKDELGYDKFHEKKNKLYQLRAFLDMLNK